MAEPLRGKRSTRKMSLKDRWEFATWVGIDVRTNEHVVVLGDEGSATRVQDGTSDVQPAIGGNHEAIKAIKATPRTPEPEEL